MRSEIEELNLSKWEKYLRCSTLPDPVSERDVNAFLAAWIDEVNDGDETNFQKLLEECIQAEKISNDAEIALAAALDQGDATKADRVLDLIGRIQEAIISKMDDATSCVLKVS